MSAIARFSTGAHGWYSRPPGSVASRMASTINGMQTPSGHDSGSVSVLYLAGRIGRGEGGGARRAGSGPGVPVVPRCDGIKAHRQRPRSLLLCRVGRCHRHCPHVHCLYAGAHNARAVSPTPCTSQTHASPRPPKSSLLTGPADGQGERCGVLQAHDDGRLPGRLHCRPVARAAQAARQHLGQRLGRGGCGRHGNDIEQLPRDAQLRVHVLSWPRKTCGRRERALPTVAVRTVHQDTPPGLHAGAPCPPRAPQARSGSRRCGSAGRTGRRPGRRTAWRR